MKSSNPDVSQSDSARPLHRRIVAVMLGALVLGCTLSIDAVAHQGPHHGADRGRQGPRFSPPAPTHGHLREPSYHGRQVARHHQFRADDRARLQQHYRRSLGSVRIDRRPHFRAGYAIPRAYRPHVVIVPQNLRRQLPPPPRGYRIGYYEGYSVVYDPVTFTILSVLDLLTH